MSPASDGITLDWAAASDDATRRRALTYDLELRRAGGVFGGSKREPTPGGLGAVDRWKMTGLPPGSYEWSVRAVDAAYNAGSRTKGAFTVKAATTGLSVTATPLNPPIRVPATGGSFRYAIQVENTSSRWKAFELSILMTKPGGAIRTVTRLTGSVAAGARFRTTLVQNVPASFAPGQYIQTVSLQRIPTSETSRSFTWVKLR